MEPLNDNETLYVCSCGAHVYVTTIPYHPIDPERFRCGRCMQGATQLELAPSIRRETRRIDPNQTQIPY